MLPELELGLEPKSPSGQNDHLGTSVKLADQVAMLPVLELELKQ